MGPSEAGRKMKRSPEKTSRSAPSLVQRREHRLLSPSGCKPCLSCVPAGHVVCWPCNWLFPALCLTLLICMVGQTTRPSWVCEDSYDACAAPGIVCAHDVPVTKVFLPPLLPALWRGAAPVLGWALQGLNGDLRHSLHHPCLGESKHWSPGTEAGKPPTSLPLPSTAPRFPCWLPKSALFCSFLP